MLVKAMGQLLGEGVRATDGRCAALEDVYFDRDCWQVCYLCLASGAGRTLVSAACVDPHCLVHGEVALSVSRAELDGGASAWPMHTALQWLDDIRVCSLRHAIRWSVHAEDGPAGEIADFVIDRATWAIDYVLVEYANGFGRGQVVLPLDWAEPLEPAEGVLRMRLTRAQLRSAPQLGA